MPANKFDAPEFTDEQLRAALAEVGDDARRAAFAAGRTVLIIRNAHFVELHPDGTERVLGPVSQKPSAVQTES